MSDATRGWKNHRKTIGGVEYCLETKWQGSRKPRLWRTTTDGWKSDWMSRRRDACSAAHHHAEENR